MKGKPLEMTPVYIQFTELLTLEDRTYTISELAETFGITLRTIRFYEERELLSPRRGAARTRVYDRDDVARLSLIVACRRFGLAVHEIAELLALRDRRGTHAFNPALVAALENRRAAITTEIAEAEALRAELGGWIDELGRAA